MIKIPVIIIGLLLISGSGFYILNQLGTTQSSDSMHTQTASPTPPSSYSATFAIYTNGQKRSFNLPMYHDLSEDVFIEARSPERVQVRKAGVTWRDFFNTLPFTLTGTCLQTGNGETYCTGEKGTLRFFINGQETPKGLNNVIQPSEHFVVVFGEPLPENLR